MGRLSEAKVAEQIRKYDGNLAAVARAFKVTRQAVSDYVHRREQLTAILQEARETMADAVESRFYKDCLKDAPAYQTSRIFYLKTQGKSRGYIEKQELELQGPGGGPPVTEVIVRHHAAAAIEDPAGGSPEREVGPEFPPGPVPRLALNGAIPSGPGGHEIR